MREMEFRSGVNLIFTFMSLAVLVVAAHDMYNGRAIKVPEVFVAIAFGLLAIAVRPL